jgi:hypothetical protein
MNNINTGIIIMNKAGCPEFTELASAEKELPKEQCATLLV